MFTKDKILKFLLAVLAFAIVDAWIFTTVRSSIRDNAAVTREKALVLLARSAPEDVALMDGWLASVGDSLPGGAAVYLVPSADDPDAYEILANDDAALELGRGLAETDDAKQGL